MTVAHDELVAPRARAPVDRADAVARRERRAGRRTRALPPSAARPRCRRTAASRRAGRSCAASRERVDAQELPPVEPALRDEQAEPVTRPHGGGRRRRSSPSARSGGAARPSARPPSRAAATALRRPIPPRARPGSTSWSSSRSTGRSDATVTSTPISSCSSARSRSSSTHARRSAGRASRSPSASGRAKASPRNASSGRRSASAASRKSAVSAAYAVTRGDAAAVIPAGAGSSAAGVGTLLEQLPHDVVRGEPLHPELRLQHQPVRERRDGELLHVVRRDEVATRERRLAAGRLQQRQAPARAGADRGRAARARRRDELDDVAADSLADVHLLDRRLELEQRRRVDHGLELDLVLAPLEPP